MLDQLWLTYKARESQWQGTGLPRAEEVTRTAHAQIQFGDLGAAVAAHELFQSSARIHVTILRHNEAASRRRRPAADAPAQLMKLREPIAFRRNNDNDGRLRNVNPDHDHGGRNQRLDLAVAELSHNPILL